MEKSSIQNEISELFAKHVPVSGVQPEFGTSNFLGPSLVETVILNAPTALKAFPFLWNVFLDWFDRHPTPTGNVKISYVAEGDVKIELDCANLTIKGIQDIMKQFPPRKEDKRNMVLDDKKKKGITLVRWPDGQNRMRIVFIA